MPFLFMTMLFCGLFLAILLFLFVYFFHKHIQTFFFDN